MFLVASGGNNLDPAEVLFEREGLRRDSSASSAPWQEAARTAGSGTQATDGWYAGLKQPYGKVTTTFGFSGGTGPVNIAACLMAAGPKHDIRTETFITHALNTANTDKGGSEHATGKDVPIIAFSAEDCGADATVQRAPTLRASVRSAIAFAQNNRGEVRYESGHGQVACTVLSNGKPGYGMPMVACVSLRGRESGLAAELGGAVSPALRASSGGADKGHVLAPDYEAHFQCAPGGSSYGGWTKWRVRRLMPMECERLQGMPDNYTLIPYRGKPAADTPRYKAIGNSMAVPCMEWLGHRLVLCLNKMGATYSD